MRVLSSQYKCLKCSALARIHALLRCLHHSFIAPSYAIIHMLLQFINTHLFPEIIQTFLDICVVHVLYVSQYWHYQTLQQFTNLSHTANSYYNYKLF